MRAAQADGRPAQTYVGATRTRLLPPRCSRAQLRHPSAVAGGREAGAGARLQIVPPDAGLRGDPPDPVPEVLVDGDRVAGPGSAPAPLPANGPGTSTRPSSGHVRAPGRRGNDPSVPIAPPAAREARRGWHVACHRREVSCRHREVPVRQLLVCTARPRPGQFDAVYRGMPGSSVTMCRNLTRSSMHRIIPCELDPSERPSTTLRRA